METITLISGPKNFFLLRINLFLHLKHVKCDDQFFKDLFILLVVVSDGGTAEDRYTKVEGHRPRTGIDRPRVTCSVITSSLHHLVTSTPWLRLRVRASTMAMMRNDHDIFEKVYAVYDSL
jgi:hypothetical protein